MAPDKTLTGSKLAGKTKPATAKVGKVTKPATAAPPQTDRVTASLIQHVGSMAQECGATVILVYGDALMGATLSLPDDLNQRVYYVTKTPKEGRQQSDKDRQVIQVPNTPLTRMGQVKIAVLLGLSRGVLKHDDTILCLTGLADSGSLDTVVVLNVSREFEMFLPPRQGEEVAPHIMPEVLERLIDLATELGREGREGKPTGALFVVGDLDRVLSLSKQLILNPFRGYPDEERNILDPTLEGTIKELSVIDGAFLIRGDGVVESAGVYLRAFNHDEYPLPQGLGARHHAAAAITAVSEAVAITVSESTGTVTIFRNGQIITEVEKPRSAGMARRL